MCVSIECATFQNASLCPLSLFAIWVFMNLNEMCYVPMSVRFWKNRAQMQEIKKATVWISNLDLDFCPNSLCHARAPNRIFVPEGFCHLLSSCKLISYSSKRVLGAGYRGKKRKKGMGNVTYLTYLKRRAHKKCMDLYFLNGLPYLSKWRCRKQDFWYCPKRLMYIVCAFFLYYDYALCGLLLKPWT